jgi:hypothetical protein
MANLQIPGSRRSNFEVEAILDHEESAGDVFFLIKWAGWAHEFNTWEPLEHLTTCYQKVVDYQRTLKPFAIVQPPDQIRPKCSFAERPQGSI